MLAALPLLASVGMAQQPDPVTACSASATRPPCTLTFTMPTVTQVPPTTTFFDSIVTTILNVSSPASVLLQADRKQIVDCQECTVVNVAPNDAPSTQVRTHYALEKTTLIESRFLSPPRLHNLSSQLYMLAVFRKQAFPLGVSMLLPLRRHYNLRPHKPSI